MALTLPGKDEILATDKIGGEHYEYIKLTFGLAGTATIVSGTNPLPVDVTPGTPAAGDYLPVRLTDGSSFITAYSAPADDSAFTVATDRVIASGYLADDTTPDSVDEGDVGIARMSLDRFQYVISALSTSEMRAAGTSLTPKFAIIDAATSGDNTLVASVSSKKIRVLSAFLVAAGAVNARFESGAAGTALTGQMNLTTNSGFTLPFNPLGWFETAATTLLNLELSAAVSVDGCLTYVEV